MSKKKHKRRDEEREAVTAAVGVASAAPAAVGVASAAPAAVGVASAAPASGTGSATAAISHILSRLHYAGKKNKLVQPEPNVAFEFTPDCIAAKRLAR